MPLLLDGITVSHDASSLTLQLTFDVTVNIVLPDVYETCRSAGVTVKTGVGAWVTVTVPVNPPPVIVIVPTLWLVDVFSVNAAVSVPLPLLLDGLTVSHDASSLTLQLIFDEIENVVLPDVYETTRLSGLIVNTGVGACVTFTVPVNPPPVTVIVPTLSLVVVFSVYAAENVPLLLPLIGLIVSHEASSLMLQFIFDVIVNVVLPDKYET